MRARHGFLLAGIAALCGLAGGVDDDDPCNECDCRSPQQIIFSHQPPDGRGFWWVGEPVHMGIDWGVPPGVTCNFLSPKCWYEMGACGITPCHPYGDGAFASDGNVTTLNPVLEVLHAVTCEGVTEPEEVVRLTKALSFRAPSVTITPDPSQSGGPAIFQCKISARMKMSFQLNGDTPPGAICWSQKVRASTYFRYDNGDEECYNYDDKWYRDVSKSWEMCYDSGNVFSDIPQTVLNDDLEYVAVRKEFELHLIYDTGCGYYDLGTYTWDFSAEASQPEGAQGCDTWTAGGTGVVCPPPQVSSPPPYNPFDFDPIPTDETSCN